MTTTEEETSTVPETTEEATTESKTAEEATTAAETTEETTTHAPTCGGITLPTISWEYNGVTYSGADLQSD